MSLTNFATTVICPISLYRPISKSHFGVFISFQSLNCQLVYSISEFLSGLLLSIALHVSGLSLCLHLNIKNMIIMQTITKSSKWFPKLSSYN